MGRPAKPARGPIRPTCAETSVGPASVPDMLVAPVMSPAGNWSPAGDSSPAGDQSPAGAEKNPHSRKSQVASISAGNGDWHPVALLKLRRRAQA